MAQKWFSLATDTVIRKGHFPTQDNFVEKLIDPEIIWLLGDSDGSRAEMRFLCSEFKIVHHCNWKDYSKSCTTHIQEYLEIINHSCHQIFGQF